jgi:hypothetical protein
MEPHRDHLGSPFLHAKFLFDEIDTGWAFVRSARALADTDVAARTLAFAQHTHDAVVRLAEHAEITRSERKRLESALTSLQAAIDACAQFIGGREPGPEPRVM